MIEAEDLTKKFGELVAVNGVTFHVDEGEAFGLLVAGLADLVTGLLWESPKHGDTVPRRLGRRATTPSAARSPRRPGFERGRMVSSGNAYIEVPT